ncbi:M16 family metallopeptidase [Aestuariimicrobium kwangyangense]|uniref:M16 family metallopeptidase n=1 Tax=Aestuariimicrobium kwangyangense TaxID=396389 RepID=UPI0003B40E98|nr:pitrilysin family protein [Aestuariimicrobium kwangyangense]
MASSGLHYDLIDHTLDNGLRVVVNPDPSSPGVAVNLWYQVGSRDEVAQRTGFAHLFEHLMFQGTWTGVGVGEHLAAIQATGGGANATTSFDRTNYFETVTPGALDLALWLEAQRMEALKVDQTNLDTQREVVKEEKRQRYDNQPYGDTFELLTSLAFGADHPYGHTPIGSMADLDSADLADVQAFYDHWYCPSNAVLVLAGQITADEALTRAQHHFGAIPARQRPTRATMGLPQVDLRGARHVVHRDVPRDTVHLVWPVPPQHSGDDLALDVALGLLSGGQSARLHQRLVRELEVAEGVSASTLGLVAGTNLALVSARVRPESSPAQVRDLLLAEIVALATEGPTDEELDRADAQTEREWLEELATVEARADEINQWTSTTGDPTAINRHLADLSAVTADDVSRALGTHLAPEDVFTLDYLTASNPLPASEKEARR